VFGSEVRGKNEGKGSYGPGPGTYDLNKTVGAIP